MHVHSKYCTRTGLWLPFDYCDLAGSKVKNLRVISCIVKIWSNGDFVQFGIILWIISIFLSHWTYWICLIYWTSLTFSTFHTFRLFGHFGHFGLLRSFRPFCSFEPFLSFEQFRLLNLLVFYISWAFQYILDLFKPLNLLNILDKENFSTISILIKQKN